MRSTLGGVCPFFYTQIRGDSQAIQEVQRRENEEKERGTTASRGTWTELCLMSPFELSSPSPYLGLKLAGNS